MFRWSHVIRFFLSFAVVIAAAGGLGYYIWDVIVDAAHLSRQIADDQVPRTTITGNVERFALRAFAWHETPSASENRWYLRKTRDALDNAAAMGRQSPQIEGLTAAVADVRAVLSAYEETATAHEVACAAVTDALQQARETAAAFLGAVAERLRALDAAPANEDVPANEDAVRPSIALREARTAVEESMRHLWRAEASGARANGREAAWALDTARRHLTNLPQESAEAEDEGPEGSQWEALGISLQAHTEAVEAVNEAWRVRTASAAAMKQQRESAVKEVQSMNLAGITGLTGQSKRLAEEMRSLQQVFAIGLLFFLLLVFVVALLTAATVGKTVDEASLPMLCQCGKLNPATAQYCGRCGQTLG
ncbi:MAG: hypothetical protein ACLFTT_06530 [Candidatus Hydrogenedentota bacterium]